jgi:GH15 family glucan-1,4-alpha-glucosidase
MAVPGRIEDYAVLGDGETAALVSVDGSIDWLCWPRFDSDACFAALLGTAEHGHWQIAPAGAARATRRYRDGTLVLETEFETEHGAATLIDFMPPRHAASDVVRIVVGRRGRVRFTTELVIRFDYGSTVPWVYRLPSGDLCAVAGPHQLVLRTPVPLAGRDLRTVGEFEVEAGASVPFVLTYAASHLPVTPVDAQAALEDTERWWHEWLARGTYDGPDAAAVRRSLTVLKSLIYRPTGGMVAAVTTSLPEALGGVRNWDYRYCWLRDSTLTLLALVDAGFMDEAKAWRDWLLRAVAGTPEQVQIMYGIGGERRLNEFELPWLPGHAGSRPVRVGNAAATQTQLDVFGEVADAMFQASLHGLPPSPQGWRVNLALLEHLERAWREPDEGLWEVRGGARHFVHSKVMAWVAFDRAVRAAERIGRDAPVARWRAVRDAIHAEVCARGYDAARGSFVQSYGSQELDASLLLLPVFGFLPADDPRILGTVAAIERELVVDGLVIRYRTESRADGLPPGEGAFLACSFWLADNYLLQGRRDEARALFDRLVALANDVGLLAEQYDPRGRRMLGNFPQAFSHVALVNTAFGLARGAGPAARRA